MHRRPLTVLLLPAALYILSQIPVVFSSAVNRSIDDTLGDIITGQRPTFLPSTLGVWEDQTCKSCSVQPPIPSAFDRTYTAATYKPDLMNTSISFDFTGTAIYIFFILANKPGRTTAANFTLDGSIAGTFTYSPNSTDPAFQFNDSALAFAKIGLDNANHRMIISTSGISDSVWVNFDYALYTFEEAEATTSSVLSSSASATSPSSCSASQKPSGSNTHAGAIVGGVISGLVALGALIAFLFFFRRRGCRQQLNNNNEAANGSTVQGDVVPFMLPAPTSQQMRQRELERQMRVINEELEDLRNEAAEHADADADADADGMTGTDAWAQELSDEPPPGYSPRAASPTMVGELGALFS